MPAFQYTALNNQGKTIKGVLVSDSDKQVRQKLRADGLIPLETYLIQENNNVNRFSFGSRISIEELALFTEQLSTLLISGIPLAEALFGVAEQTNSKKLKNIILAVRSDVLEGQPLAKALGQFPSVFSDLYRASIHAGEQTGHLDKILNRLSEYLEKQQQLKHKIQQALIYPSLMIVVSISIVSFLLTYVVPKIISVFQDTKQELPFMTQILLSISHFLHEYGFFVLIFLIVLFWVLRITLKKPLYKERWHLFLLKIPLIGFLIKNINIARFARTLGMLTSSGIPIVDALKIANAVLTISPIQKKLYEATELIIQGKSIYKAFKESQQFSPLTVHLIHNGEMSGQLEQMFNKAAEIQERQVNRLIDFALTLFEPLIILLMGGIVLFIVLSILLPIFQMEQISG